MSNIRYHLYAEEDDVQNMQKRYFFIDQTTEATSDVLTKRFGLKIHHGRALWAVRSDRPDVWADLRMRGVGDPTWSTVRECDVPQELKMLHLLNV
jgi:hypothetical protein